MSICEGSLTHKSVLNDYEENRKCVQTYLLQAPSAHARVYNQPKERCNYNITADWKLEEQNVYFPSLNDLILLERFEEQARVDGYGCENPAPLWNIF